MERRIANINRQAIMGDGSVHNLTKEVLTLSKDKDCVDAYYDVKLALEVLHNEMNEGLKA